MDNKTYKKMKKKKKQLEGFQAFNLNFPVLKAVKQKGFKVPTPIQMKAIPLIMEGCDVVACSRTGSGKTGAFLIPMINRLKVHSNIVGTRAVIVVPSRELSHQTVTCLKDFIKFTDLTYALIVGGHGFEGQFEMLATNPDIIITTPGRFMHHLNETNFSLQKVQFLVFDEADCLFEQGFQEQILTILKKTPQNRQTLMFSATIPQEISQFAKAGLKEYVYVKLDHESQIPKEIQLNFFLVKSEEKVAGLLYVLDHLVRQEESSIVFCSTRFHVEYYHQLLHKFEIPSLIIYGKMDQLARSEQISLFKKREIKIIFVTDLVSRGIDLDFVRYIINMDFPQKTKDFIHRCGRTGRAGKKGSCFTIMQPNEKVYLAETLIHIGSQIKTDEIEIHKEQDNQYSYYGVIPTQVLAPIQEQILRFTADSIEISNSKRLCGRGYKNFRKSRASASKASKIRSKELEINSIHPLLRKLINTEKYQEESLILQKLKGFKPKQCYIAWKANKENNTQVQLLDQKMKDHLKRKKEIQKELLESQQNEEKYEHLLLVKRKHLKDVQEISVKNQQKKKRKKRSQIRNFRHPTQFISNQPSNENRKLLEDLRKITHEDIHGQMLTDDYTRQKSQKQYKWQAKKGKYVFANVDQKGQIIREKKVKRFGQEKIRREFSSFKRKYKISYQKVGQVENTKATQRAHDLFNRRKREKFLLGKEDQLKQQQQKSRHKSKKFLRNPKFRRELKTRDEIFKMKKTKAKRGFKQMNRKKRKRIVKKYRK